MKVYCRGNKLFDEINTADNFISRFIGLMGTRSIKENEGLLLKRCPFIHCFFMKFTIDAVYLDNNMTVLDKETITPWKIGKIVKKASHVLELSKGSARKISIGDILDFVE